MAAPCSSSSFSPRLSQAVSFAVWFLPGERKPALTVGWPMVRLLGRAFLKLFPSLFGSGTEV
jgi:hypothetical protein